MGSCMYGKLLPDNGDLDNVTKTAPGYRVFVCENNGGVELSMIHADDDPVTTPGYQVFMNPDEAEELIHGLREAVQRARPKNANHPARGKPC